MKNLNLPISILIMLLLLHSYVKSEDPCEDRNVIGAVGGAVTLHVRYTGVTKIIWTFKKISAAIATTRPGGAIEIDDKRYKGRLSSTSDGFLIITQLRLEDQGTYWAQIITDKETPRCDYHLTLFSNLTAEDVTISSNVTDNKTCEVILTCSVNGSNVTVTWRSVNSSDITGRQNVMFVPPRNINFTYICTAENPVSNASKAVHPWRYCDTDKKGSQPDPRNYYYYYLIVLFVLTGIPAGAIILSRRKKKNSEDVNKAMEPQESQSNDTTCNTVYSTVQHGKQKNNQTKQPSPSKGRLLKGPPKPPHKVSEPPKDKKDQKSPSEGPNGNCSKTPLESCYAEVQLPQLPKNTTDLESCYAEVQLPKQ